MASKYWIKIYHEILDDPKMGRMSDMLWRRTIELFLIAGEQDNEGHLPKLGDMAYRLRLSDDELSKDLDELQKMNIIHSDDGAWIVTKFAERQLPVSDAERMRRFRERQRKENYYRDKPVTSLVTNRSQIRLDKNRLDKSRPLIDLFCEITKVEMPNNGSIYSGWITEINKWKKIGVIGDDIQKAFNIAIEKNYTIKRPGGLTTFIEGEVRDRTQKEKEMSKYQWAHEMEKE